MGVVDVVINGRFLTQPLTGVQRYARELVTALDRLLDAGLIVGRVELVTPHWGVWAVPPLRRISIRPVGALTGHAWEQLELPLVAAGKVLFCPGNTAPLLSLGKKHTRVAVTIHSLSSYFIPEAYSWSFRTLYSVLMPRVTARANTLLTVSETERQVIAGKFPVAADKLHVVPNGAAAQGFLEIAACRSAAEANQPPFPAGYLLYVGSLSRGKNLAGFLRAVSRLAERRPVHAVVVGAASGVFADCPIEPHPNAQVSFLGPVQEPAALAGLYRAAGCLVFPSFYESSGLPPTEAMACDCPVVASDIPALRERCADAALYCDPHNPDHIAHQVEQVLADPDQRSALVTAGRRRVAFFRWEACAEKTWDILAAA